MDHLSNGATTMSVNDVTHLVMNTGQIFHSLSVVEIERDKLKAQCTAYRNKLKNANRVLLKVKEDNSGEILEKTKNELNHYINLYHTSTQERAKAQSECKKAQEDLIKEQKKNQKPTSRSNKDKLCHQYQDKILELELEVDEWKSKHDEVSRQLNQQHLQSKDSITVKREEYQNITQELQSLRTNYSLLIGDNKRLKERDKMLEENVENLKLKNGELTQKIELQSKTIENLSTCTVIPSTNTSSSYIVEPQNFKSLDLDLIDTLEDKKMESQQNLDIFGLDLIDENMTELQVSDEIPLTSVESECEEDDADDLFGITQDRVRQILDEMINNRPTCLSPIPPSPKKIQSHQNRSTKLDVEEEYKKLTSLIENERQKLNTMRLDVIATEKEFRTVIEEERRKLAQAKEENNKFDDVLTQQQTKLNSIKVDITNAQHKFSQIIENQKQNCAKIEKLENEQKKFNLAKLDVIEAQKKINEMVEELKALKEENGKLKVTLENVLVENDESLSKKNIGKARGLTVQETKLLAQKIARKEIRTHLIKKNAILKAKLKKERNILIRIGFKRGRRSHPRLGSGMNDPILDGYCGQRSVDSGYIISDNECDSFEVEHEEIVNSIISVDAQLPMSCSSSKKVDDSTTSFDAVPVELPQDSIIYHDDIETLESDCKSEMTENRTTNCETSVISTKISPNDVSNVEKEENKSNVTTNQINITSYYIALPSPAKKTLPVENIQCNRSLENYFCSIDDDDASNCVKPITSKSPEKTVQDLQDLLEDDLNLSESDCDEKAIENTKDLREDILQKIENIQDVRNVMPHQSFKCEEIRTAPISIEVPLGATIHNIEDVQNKASLHCSIESNVQTNRSLFDLTDESDGSVSLMIDDDCFLENDFYINNDHNIPEEANKNSQDATEKILPITTMLPKNVVQDSKNTGDSLNEIQKDGFYKNDCRDTYATENNVKTLDRPPENNFYLKDEGNAAVSTKFSKTDNINSSTTTITWPEHNVEIFKHSQNQTPHILDKNCSKVIPDLQNEAPKRIDASTSIATKFPETDVQNSKHIQSQTLGGLNLGSKSPKEAATKSQNETIQKTQPKPQNKIENVQSLFGDISDDSDVPLVVANKRSLKDNFYFSDDSDSESSVKNEKTIVRIFTDPSDDSDVPLSNIRKIATKSTKESLPKKKLCPSKRKRFLRDRISSARNKFVLAVDNENENKIVDSSESLSCKGVALPVSSSDTEGPVSLPISRVEPADSGKSRIVKKRKVTNDKKENVILPNVEHSPRRSLRNLGINNAILDQLRSKSQLSEERTYKRPNCWANQKKVFPPKQIEQKSISVAINADLIGFDRNGEMILSSSELDVKVKKDLWEKTHKLPPQIEIKTKVMENKWIDLPFLPLISPKIKNEDILYNKSPVSPKPDIKNEDFTFPKVISFQNESEFRNKWTIEDEKKPELYNLIPQTFKSEDFPFEFKQENHEMKLETSKQEVNKPSTSRKMPTNYEVIEKALLMLFEVPSNSMINILLSNYEIKPLCRVIVKMSTEDFECKPVKRSNPIAPILSEYQIVLLRLLIAMTRKDDNTRRIFLKIAERVLLTINSPIHLEPIARLHVAYMKYFHQFVHAKSFIFCSLANMGNLAVPYLYFLASSWSEVFVKYQDASGNDRLLIRAIISLLMNKQLREPEYYKQPLISFLTQIQQFPSDVTPISQMLKDIINEYLGKRCDKSKIMILIIGRNVSGPIFYKQFVCNLKLVQFKNEADIDVALDLLNFLICNIFEINEPTVMMINEWLSVLLQSCHSENTKKNLTMIRSKINALC